MSFDEQEELDTLLSDLVDDRMDATGMRRLEEVISRTESARRRYLEHMQMSASLCGYADESVSGGGELEVCGQPATQRLGDGESEAAARQWGVVLAASAVAAGVGAFIYHMASPPPGMAGDPSPPARAAVLPVSANPANPAVFGVAHAGFPHSFVENFEDEVLGEGLHQVGMAEYGGGHVILRKLGDAEMDQPSGVVFDVAAIDGPTGPTASWVMETIVADVDAAGPLETLISFNGRFGVRRSTQATRSWRLFYFGDDGERTPSVPGPHDGDHVAVVFEEMGLEDTISYYLNGELCKSFTGAFNHSANYGEAAFGCDVVSDSQGFADRSRGLRGSLDAIAFRSFEGPFHAASDGFALLELR